MIKLSRLAFILGGLVASQAWAFTQDELQARLTQLEKKVAYLEQVNAKLMQQKSNRSSPDQTVYTRLTDLEKRVHANQSGAVKDDISPHQASPKKAALYPVRESFPSMYEELALLQYMTKHPSQQSWQVRGSMNAQWFAQHTPTRDTSQLSLSGFSVSLLAHSNPWMHAIASLSYDNNPFNDNMGYRISNSRLYLQRALMVWGDLKKHPYYGALGQLNAPFGSHQNALMTSPLTLSLGRLSMRGAVFGYRGDHWRHALFVGNVDSATASSYDQINEGGVQSVYERGDWAAGLGWAWNVAASSALTTALDTKHQQMVHPVGGLDAFVTWRSPWGVWHSEYVKTLRRFDQDSSDVLANTQPSAWHMAWSISQGKWAYALAYDHAWEATFLPRESLTAGLSIKQWLHAKLAFELRRQWGNLPQTRATTQFSMSF